MHEFKENINFSYLHFRRYAELFLILICSPVFLLIFVITAIWIKIDSAGNILFPQIRPGKDGHLFKIYKFRSMYTGSDSSFLTLKNDQRITKSGRFIRKYRIDELPQIFNIIKGDMSLIGPRPVPVNFLSVYEKNISNYQLRHLIRPGITGLAQIKQGYTTSIEQERIKLKYDLFYIKSLSYKMDIAILLQTIKVLKK
jgi:lipopolysaccharide/colanic/teichoic acid biosynthesis glycosyltransferase